MTSSHPGAAAAAIALIVLAVIVILLPLGALTWDAVIVAEPAARDRAALTAPVNLPAGAFLGTWELLGRTSLWILAITGLATVVGWPLGLFVAGRLAMGRGRLAALLCALPLCLPAYLMFWSLWHLVEPTSWIGDRMLRMGAAVGLREAALVVALTLWAAPIVAWCVVAARRAQPDRSADVRALDGAGWIDRVRGAWRHDRGVLAVGAGIVILGVLGESVSFDLAQVRTYGFELRSLDLTGASPATMLAAGWPAIGVALAMVLVVGLAIRSFPLDSVRGTRPEGSPSRAVQVAGVLLLAAVIALPLALVLQVRSFREIELFLSLYARPALTSLGIAALAGALVGILAMMVAVVRLLGGRWSRGALSLATVLFALGAALPATLVAVGLERAWNTHTAGPLVYDTAVIVLLALLARFGVVAAIVGVLVARREAVRSETLLLLDGPRSVAALWTVARPALLSAAVIAGLAGASLAFSEIVVTSRLQQPRLPLLATSTLNAIHYQQPETVLVASSGAILLGTIGCAAAVLLIGRRRSGPPAGRSWSTAAMIATAAFFSLAAPIGCESADTDDRPAPIPAARTFGSAGFGPGQFRTPRAVAHDATRGLFYVVDKSARIQRFAADGTPEREWRMPESTIGMPVGMSVHPDGRLFVADTHYHRILVFDADGTEVGRFGSYGTGPGQFIYPTDIAFGNDGRIYVGEYGGNDRIQIFSPGFEPLAIVGSFGSAEGQWSRPQGLAFHPERNELYVADSNNHRVVVCDPEGRLLRSFGVAGTAVGQLSYPRGIVFCPDGSVMVVEFGNHRVQRFDSVPGPTFGTSRGIWGGMCESVLAPAIDLDADVVERHREAPVEPGRLKYPWDMAGVPGHVIVLDSGNNRVMLARLPS